MESWFELSQELAHLKRVVINTRKNDVLRREKNPLILYVTNWFESRLSSSLGQMTMFFCWTRFFFYAVLPSKRGQEKSSCK